MVSWLLQQVCAVPVAASAQKRLVDVADSSGKDASTRMLAVVQTICTLPEIHLT